MKTLKFFLIAFFISLIFIPFGKVQAEEFEVYYPSSIKDHYCARVIDYKYCKCAFHGQYCEAVGMDSGSANSYVQSSYNVWEAGVKEQVQALCFGENIIWTIQNGNVGCLTCTNREYLIGKECKTVEELCSSDELVDYEPKSRQCFCPTGYDITNEYTCEAICGEDLNIYFDAETEECKCVTGYELKEDEEEYLFCEEIPELDLSVEVMNDAGDGPYTADGETEVEFLIKGIYQDSQEIADLRFDISYTTTTKAGAITSVTGDAENGYTVKYLTSDLRESELFRGGEDYIFVFYQSKRSDSEIYTKHEIKLVTGVTAEATITKYGFTPVTATIVFTNDKANINVYTIAKDGSKTPVNNADVTHSEFFTRHTDSNGLATIEAPKQVQAEGDIQEIEVILELDPKVQAERDAAWAKYTELGRTYNYFSQVVQDFLNDIPSYLAVTTNDEQAKKGIAGIKQSKYVFFYLKQGTKIGEDASSALADSIGTALWDLMDMLDPFKGLKDKLSGFINNKIGGTDFEFSDGLSQNFKMDLAKKMEKVLESTDDIIDGFIAFVRIEAVKATVGTNKFSPSWLDQTIKQAVGSIAQDLINAAGDAGSPKKMLNDALQTLNKDIATELMGQLESKIVRYDFNEYGDAYLESAKVQYVEFNDWYLEQHDLEYNATMVKQWIELGFNIFGKAAQILYPKSAGLIVEYLETVYKGVRSGLINNVQLYTWFKAYTKNQDMMINNFETVLSYNVDRKNLLPHFAKTANAENGDYIQKLYESDLQPESKEYTDVLNYVTAENENNFYSTLAELTEMLVEIEPENEDLLSLHNNLEDEIIASKTEMKNTKESLKIIAPEAELETEMLTSFEWIILLVLTLGLAAIVYGFIKFLKWIISKLKKKKISSKEISEKKVGLEKIKNKKVKTSKNK